MSKCEPVVCRVEIILILDFPLCAQLVFFIVIFAVILTHLSAKMVPSYRRFLRCVFALDVRDRRHIGFVVIQ